MNRGPDLVRVAVRGRLFKDKRGQYLATELLVSIAAALCLLEN